MKETIGARLKQTREERHLSIGQVAEQTRIRPHYLQALENDDLSAIPSAVQARGFLRIYADLLRLNLDDLAASARALELSFSDTPAASAASPALDVVAVPKPEPQPRPNFISGFRARFTPRSSSETISGQPESTAG